jgi:hypothetical protein
MSRLIVKNLPNGVSEHPRSGDLKVGAAVWGKRGGRELRFFSLSDLESQRGGILGLSPRDGWGRGVVAAD